MADSGVDRKGVPAVLAVVLAILGITYLPRKAAETATGAEARKPAAGVLANIAKGKTPAPPTETSGSCEQIANRLHRLYPPPKVSVPMPGSCYQSGTVPSGAVPNAPNELNFVVAIVPNPVQTHLPLLFDRAIEAIQQAVEDSGYTYDGSWFPWNHFDKPFDALSDEEQAAQLEAELQKQPGIMVFRRGIDEDSASRFDRELVVFVVAEQPTGGISDAQFEHSLEWILRLQPARTDRELLILGPMFSGTLPSLARQITPDAVKPFAQGVRVFSGANSSDNSVSWFNAYLNQAQATMQKTGWKGSLRYRTFYEGDSVMTDRFLCYLQHEGYDLNHVAILSEDETAFGKAPPDKTPSAGNQPDEKKPATQATSKLRCQNDKADAGSPIFLYYPRDIASLRSAYEQQSIFSGGKSQANAPSTSLRGNLSEPASTEHDTVRTYAGQLTPLAQEAQLFGIANVLDNKDIEFIIIRSSNSLDQLFLSEFLRRSYPNGRVVIDGADLMFRRGMQGASLRGVILLSPYPLLSWTHDSIPPIEGLRSNSYRVFPQDLAEGTYIAARELLKGLPGGSGGASISDYGAIGITPDKSKDLIDQRPSTWVTVVGHRQFWPLAVLNENSQVEEDGDKFGATAGSILATEKGHPAAPGSKPKLPGEMSALVAACVLFSLLHFGFCATGSIYRSPRARAYFAPVPWVQQPILIFIGSLLVGWLGVTLWFVVSFGMYTLSSRFTSLLRVSIVTIFIAAFLGMAGNYLLHVISGIDTAPRKKTLSAIKPWRIALAIVWIPVLAVLAWGRYLYLTQHLNLANRFPAFWRSVFLRSGVSPLLPQVLLILGLYLWFWFNLRGLALFGDDRPLLPRIDDLPHFATAADHKEREHDQHSRVVKMFRMFSREVAGDRIERSAMPLGSSYAILICAFLGVSWCVLWVALGGAGFRTLGDLRFGTVIYVVVGMCIALILADTAQLIITWGQLRELLVFLDRLRLRRTLSTLRGLYGGSVWKLSGNVLEERYRLISRQFESMRNLQNAVKAWTTADDLEKHRKHLVVEQLKQCDERGFTFATWYVDLFDDQQKVVDKAYNIGPLADFQATLAGTAGCVMENIILPAWQTDSHCMIRGANPKEKEAEFDKIVDELPPYVRAAEEFFLLPYAGFVQNTLGRIRNIGLSIVTMFIAATLSVSSYPFDPLPVIGAVFLVLFAIVGGCLIFAYAEMSRDVTLSRIANTNPGELGWEFWVKIATLGAGPLLGLLTTLFPSMTDFVVSFLQPGAQAIK